MIFLLWLHGCAAPSAAPAPTKWANVAPARVVEALRGDGRSYLRVQEAEYDFWISAPVIDAKVGDALLIGRGPLRHDYTSKELGRAFSAITEVDAAKVDTTGEGTAPLPAAGIDIATLYLRRAELAGTPVEVRGRVVKANKGIFGKNWYHLRDGTGAEGSNDLTVTTDADASLGDVVLASGALAIDKDLGFGYFFPAIVEDAKMVKE